MSGASDSPADAVVLLSGGLDSATTLAIARGQGRRCVTLGIDYGQRHRHELLAAQQLSRMMGAAEHVVVRIDLRAIGGSALTSDEPVPKADGVEPSSPGDGASINGIPVTYVPARNLAFLSLAIGLAEVRGAREIWIGVNAVDYSGYPDCRPEFIEAFTRTANLGTREGVVARERGEPMGHFQIVTPIIEWSKAQIIRKGTELGVDYSRTHSCYDPVSIDGRMLACGRCDSCRIRAGGFREAGVADPTAYAP